MQSSQNRKVNRGLPELCPSRHMLLIFARLASCEGQLASSTGREAINISNGSRGCRRQWEQRFHSVRMRGYQSLESVPASCTAWVPNWMCVCVYVLITNLAVIKQPVRRRKLDSFKDKECVYIKLQELTCVCVCVCLFIWKMTIVYIFCRWMNGSLLFRWEYVNIRSGHYL